MIQANFCGLVAVVGHDNDSNSNSYRPLSVKSVDVKVDIRGWAAGTTATLTYENNEPTSTTSNDNPVDVQFVFPLIDNIGVCRFEANIDGKIAVAKCQPLQATAQTKNENANGAISADVYRLPIGKVAPGKKVVITLGLVQQMRRLPDNGCLVLDSAGVLIPRQLPRWEIIDANSVRDKLRLSANHVSVTDAEYQFKFRANVNLGLLGHIGGIRFLRLADTSTVKTKFSDDKTFAKIKLTRERFRPSGDLQVAIEPSDVNLPAVYVENGTSAPCTEPWLNKTAVGCWFEPGTSFANKSGIVDEQATERKDEYWLILDRSGSMFGTKNEEAKKMLLLFVKSLPVGSLFNIIGFGSTFETLFPNGCVNYNESTADVAVQYATNLKANLGGTSVMGPLNSIYTQPKPKNRRFIILLTDGQFGESFDSVRRVVTANAATSSLFTIGIGKDVNRQVLVDLARSGSGMSEFIEGVADFQTKVIKIMKAVSNQSMAGLKIDWNVEGGLIDKRVPSQLASAFYYGSPMVQCVDIKRTAVFDVPIKGRAVLTGAGGIEHTVDFVIPPDSGKEGRTDSNGSGAVALNFEDSPDEFVLHQFVAFKTLFEMLETPSRLNDAVKLSEATGILCKYTSYVLHDPANQQLILDGNSNVLASSNSNSAAAGFRGPTIKAEIRVGKVDEKTVQLADDVVASASSFEAMAGLQQTNGSWKLDEPLVKVVGSPHLPNTDALKKRVVLSVGASMTKPIDGDDETIATLVGLAQLRRRFLDRHEHWEIIEQKAHLFLSSKSNDVDEELLDSLAARIEAVEDPTDEEKVRGYGTREEIFAHIDKHALEVSRMNQDKFQDTVTKLIRSENINSDLEKSRALFIWLSSKNLATMQFTNVEPGSPEQLLLGLKEGRETYAAVFEMLCSRVGLTCVTIDGFVKGIGYRPGVSKFDGDDFRGSWNAVKIDGQWGLVYCNWAARRVVADDLQYNLDEFFFLTNPKHMIHTHFPHQQNWQLLEKPITLTDFEFLPPAKGLFFTIGLSLIGKAKQAVLLAHDGEVTIELAYERPENAAKVDFDYSLLPSDAKGEEQKEAAARLHGHVFHEVTPTGSIRFHLRLPSAGDFRLIVFSTTPEPNSQEPFSMARKNARQTYTDVCEWKVVSDRAASNPLSYPPCSGSAWGAPHPAIARSRGFTSLPQNARVTTNKDGVAEFELVIADPTKKPMYFVGKLRTNEQGYDEKALETPLMHRLLGKERAIFTISAPGKGEFGLEIFTNRVDDEADDKDDNFSLFPLCQYLIVNEQAAPGPQLPTLPTGFLGPQRAFPDGLNTLSHHDPFITIKEMNQPLQIDFSALQGLLSRAVANLLFVTAPGLPDEDVSAWVLHQTPAKNDRLSFVCRFAKAGTYRLEIFALAASSAKSDSLPCIYNYLIDVRDDNRSNIDPATILPFPKQFSQWHDGCSLVEPFDGAIDVNTLKLSGKDSLSFKLTILAKNVKRLLVVRAGLSRPLTVNEDGEWEGTCPLDMLMKVTDDENGDKLHVMANYDTDPADAFVVLLEYKVLRPTD